MAYQIIGSLRSPFVRLNRIYMINRKIDCEFRMINFLEDKNDAEFLARINPVNKVPVLLNGEQPIFDSRVIFNYLNKKHDGPVLSVEDENRLTIILGCIDVGVNLFLLKTSGVEMKSDNWFLKRQNQRVDTSIGCLVPWVKSLSESNESDWNYVSMALFCYLDWADFRNLIDIQRFPEMVDFLRRFRNSVGVRQTEFRI
jgi:glutathione S-transferase